MAWGKNGTPETLASAGALNITDLDARNFNVQLIHWIQNSAILEWQLDGLSTSTYAFRLSDNGGADSTGTSDTKFISGTSASNDEFSITYYANISGEETLAITFDVGANTAGVTNAPRRREVAQKQTSTSQFTQVDTTNSGNTNSNISMLGTD